MRLCFFGNSHVAALREAWLDHPGRWQDFDATFIGAHKGVLLETEIRDGHLFPTTDAALEAFEQRSGIAAIDIGAYDAFVVVGCLVAMPQASLVYADMRWPGLPSLADIADISRMDELFVSYATARAALIDNLSIRIGPEFVRRLRPATDKPIWQFGTPRLSERLLDQRRPHLRAYASAVRVGDAMAMSALYEDAAATVARDAGAVFVPQPPETIVNYVLTSARHMDGAHRLTTGEKIAQPPNDVAHGNALYGAAILNRVAQIVRGDR